jgi:RecA-family ATPase
MIPMQELIEEEILERLRKILKGVNVIPHQVNKFSATNLPPVVSVIYLK